MNGKANGLFYRFGGLPCPIMSCIQIGGSDEEPLFSVVVLLPHDELNTMPIFCSRSDIERHRLN